MVKMTKVQVEIDLFNLLEIKEHLVKLQEFVEAVRDLRTAEKMYYKTRNDEDAVSVQVTQNKVDKLLKKYPKNGWKK